MQGRRVALTVGGLVALAVALGAAAPRTAAGPGVDRQAWARTGPVPTFVAEDDRIYVAVTAGREEARAFVSLDVSGVPPARLSTARLVLGEADGGFMVESASLAACALAGPFPDEGAEAPDVDCTTRAPASRGVDGTWAVPLGVFASGWAGGEVAALALVPDTASQPELGSWRVALDVARTSLALAPEVPPATTARPSGTPPATAPPPGPGAGDAAVDLPPVAYEVPAATMGAPVTPTDAPPTPPAAPSVSGRRVAARVFEPGALPAGFVFGLLAALVAAGGVAIALSPMRCRVEVPPRLRSPAGRRALLFGAAAAVPLLALGGGEVTVFKAGMVLIFVVAALGLHVLVNWSGQLSLAHAGMVGLPAFVVLAISDVHDVSPVYLVPVAGLVGGAVGGVVALPALRARGMQVALVTLVTGIAIDRFFFTNQALVGRVGGRAAATPTLGPLELSTSRSLYPLLVAVVVVAGAAVWALMHSKVGRAWFWVRDDPEAAAAYGVPVVAYRILAFVVAGVLAGIAGGMSVMWLQHLSHTTFPTTLSFSYLLVVVLAGPGFIGGLALLAFGLEGGRLYAWFPPAIVDYLGPVALVLNVARYPGGINQLGRAIMDGLRGKLGSTSVEEPTEREPIGLSFVGGVVAIVSGFVAIGVAWYHLGDTNQVLIQNQELLSGGIGGLALVLVGTGLLIRDRLNRLQQALTRPAAAPVETTPEIEPRGSAVPRRARARQATGG